ncbi:MAG: hypothetical protein R3300_01350 [Candidatus Promineifilaceae bacterium]|nr:hypothetical protein [Candidatus Promineifilaceae bacterium]
MQDSLIKRIKVAVKAWAKTVYATEAIVLGPVALDDEDDEEAERYLADYAVEKIGHWRVAEVWVNDSGRVLSIHDLGEGLPLDDASWPWSVNGDSSQAS